MKLLWFVVVMVIILQMCWSDELPEDVSLFEIPFYPSCIEPGYEKSCSGHGVCIEGSCICDSLEDIDPLYRYSGKYCEECPYCKGQRCEKIFKCLKECRNNQNCDNTTCSSEYDTGNKTLDEKLCFMEDENGCFVNFKYAYESDRLLVFENFHKDCYNGYAIVLYVFIGVNVYIVSLFALIHCSCDRCPPSKKSSTRRSNVDIVRIPTSLID